MAALFAKRRETTLSSDRDGDEGVSGSEGRDSGCSKLGQITENINSKLVYFAKSKI